MNEKILTQLRIIRLSKLKPNFSDLSRSYGFDRRTIKKYYDGYIGKPKSHNKGSKLDVHKQTIQEKLTIKGTTVKSVYEYIKSEINTHIGTYSNFYKYVITNKLNTKKSFKGHPRFETPPGYQAQVDWKEDMHIANKYGEIFTFQVFDYILGHSRYCHFTYKTTKTRQDVFDCLIQSFKATGGVPTEILFDNMASVVDLKDGHRHINNQMLAFAHDFNFTIRLAKPRHPYTKGKVEVINKYLSWLLPYEGEFETENDIINILSKINEKVNQEICQDTNIPPILLFQKEKEHLQSLPSNRIVNSYLTHNHHVIVQKDSMITYKNNKYSVPPAYIGKSVSIKDFQNKLSIYYNTELIAVHRISCQKLNYQKDHYIALFQPLYDNSATIQDLAEKNLKQMDTLL